MQVVTLEHIARGDGSNRTFMELKCDSWLNRQRQIYCSNRTFMELKFLISAAKVDDAEVLIVPLWN